ncbi:MAG: DUF1631 family protein [Pseudomonadota bacterium]
MSSPPPSPLPPAGQILANAGLPRRVLEALELTLDLVVEHITQPLDRVLPALAGEVATLDDYGAQHRVTFDALGAPERLLRDGEAMTRLFLGGIERELAGLRDPPAPRATAAPTPDMPRAHELRLVDEDEDDAATIIGSLALRHESRSALPIQLLCQRFGVLAGAPAFEPGTLPVGPRRLAELLTEASAAAGFGLQLTAAVLREFDRQVLATYGPFAETLNALLARLGVMPGLSYVPLRPRPRPAGAFQPEASAGEAATVSHLAAPATEAAATVPLAADDAPGFDLLRHLLAARRGLAERFRHPPAALQPRPELDTASALRVLDAAQTAPAEGDFDALRQWLLLRARHERGTAVALSAADADSFELLALLYAQLSQDVQPGAPALRMLAQLRLPLARVALADRHFFENPAHPARQLLNVVADSGAVGQSADDVDPQFLAQLQQVVDAVARAPGDPAPAFVQAVEMLEAQQQALQRRAEMAERRSVEAARGKERLAVARRRASTVIEAAMTGLQLPAFHRNMLRQAWADVLTLAHLRHGEEAEEWISLVGDTRDLARAGAGQAPAPEGLAGQAEQWLVTVGHHQDDAARIARILTASPEEACDDAASRTELTLRLKGRARLGEDAVGETQPPAPRTAAEETAYARLRMLPFGTWMTFRGDDGRPVRRRLAWWSPSTDAVLFVNQRGQRAAESTLDAVARELAAGRAAIVPADEGGVVDRAWRAVVHSLRGFVARDAGARALR